MNKISQFCKKYQDYIVHKNTKVNNNILHTRLFCFLTHLLCVANFDSNINMLGDLSLTFFPEVLQKGVADFLF